MARMCRADQNLTVYSLFAEYNTPERGICRYLIQFRLQLPKSVPYEDARLATDSKGKHMNEVSLQTIVRMISNYDYLSINTSNSVIS